MSYNVLVGVKPGRTTHMTLTNVTIYEPGLFGVNRIDCRTVTITEGVQIGRYTNAIRINHIGKGKRKEERPLILGSQDRHACIIVDTKDAVPTRKHRTTCVVSLAGGSYDREDWAGLKEDLRNNQSTVLFDYAEKVGA